MHSLESISQLKLPPQVDCRLQELMNRKTAGLLSNSEQQELELLLEVNQILSLLRAKAKNRLVSAPTSANALSRSIRNGLPVMQVSAATPVIDPDLVQRCLREDGF